MATQFTCPNCHSSLSTNNPVPAGLEVDCPQCKSPSALPRIEKKRAKDAPGPARVGMSYLLLAGSLAVLWTLTSPKEDGAIARKNNEQPSPAPNAPPRIECKQPAAVVPAKVLDWLRDEDGTTETRRGVTINDPLKTFKGYTLIAPMRSGMSYLIDMEGRIAHTWETDRAPNLYPYLLDNGNLLRPCTLPDGHPDPGGRVEELSWDGTLLWEYTFGGKNQHVHHDIAPLPNGNILMIMSDRKNAGEAVMAGRRDDLVREILDADGIIEVMPTGPDSGEIVWEWHCWDHLVQDHDRSKANFDKISAHPERIDLNYTRTVFGTNLSKVDLDKLKGLGYLGGGEAENKNLAADIPDDWTHCNAIAYNAELDQIMISVHGFNEFWIIDHSTTTAEAAGSTGGKYGKGGDLLYRWGNPQAYRSGSNGDKKLFHQHNTHWIPHGLPGAGHVLIFNNGWPGRPDGLYSSIDEIELPVDKAGTYDRKPGLPFGPLKTQWTYTTDKKTDFYAPFISGAQRLPNGNTLICSGTNGVVFEVTPEKEIVWKFVTPSQADFGGLLGVPAVWSRFGWDGLFRGCRYGLDHPAFQGKKLVPGKRIEEL